MSFDTVLVANRGEIALRIFRTAERLGYRTIAVYSDADRDAMHVRAADRAVYLGASAPRDSYLSIEKIVAAAGPGVAIHPGYGFLSENADFARAIAAAGLVFIGPDADSIDAMGNKSAAKARMIAAGVPCVPGYLGDDQSDARMIEEGRRIGFPLMVKAAAGGGGRGMRLVQEESALAESLRAARSEAESAFGNGQLLLERAVVGARHVEIQVFGDRHGNVVHFGERDCSIQRRNQKVVEESPSPAVSNDLRLAMGDAAVKAARAVKYVGAGTVELLLAADGQFYFLEMNTRLQVEHAVTEQVYDVDLVEWQLRIAAGEPLPWTQEQILARRRGHSIEVRLCAENAEYRPQTGTILRYVAPGHVRTDAAIEDGFVVSPFYDSMLGKVIAHGADREEARRRLISALEELAVLGITTNRELLHAILASPRFASGQFSTSFLVEESLSLEADESRLVALAALTLWLVDAAQLEEAHLTGWDSTELAATPITLDETTVRIQPRKDGLFELSGGANLAITARLDGDLVRYEDGGRAGTLRFARAADQIWICAEGRDRTYVDRTYAPPVIAESNDGNVRAAGAGKVLRVNAQVGDRVSKNQSLIVVESMKMELDHVAAFDGIVREMHARVGAQVAAQRILAVVSRIES